MAAACRAAVIGASGIGRHHARWLAALGCQVVAFAGSAQERVDATAEVLSELFGFSGRGYVGAAAMLDAAQPEVVAICSPPWLHYEHFLQAAEHGCHIMCEKPLVWDPQKPLAQLVAEAGHLVEVAAQSGKVAAVNTQYVAAREPYLRVCELAGRPTDLGAISQFYMRMDSRGGRYGAAGQKIWIDLASHPLSVLMALAGTGQIVPGSAVCEIRQSSCEATFLYATTDGREVRAHVELCNVPSGPLVRRFGVDGVLADYEGRNDEDGVYSAYLKIGDVELKATDFVQTSLSRFVDAVRGQGAPLASVEDGWRNLRLQLQILQAGGSRRGM